MKFTVISFTPLQTYKVLKQYLTHEDEKQRFTPLQTYKVLKRDFIGFMLGGVLHHYKLTRFSNRRYVNCRAVEFYTITNLQGSQTGVILIAGLSKFYTITNLQGSQTSIRWQRNHNCFTPLQTYKVLKHCNCQMVWNCSFTPLQTYKVLKQICVGWEQPTVLHHYKLTRFSNWRDVDSWAIEFYTITNLQGSQTDCKTFEP